MALLVIIVVATLFKMGTRSSADNFMLDISKTVSDDLSYIAHLSHEACVEEVASLASYQVCVVLVLVDPSAGWGIQYPHHCMSIF